MSEDFGRLKRVSFSSLGLSSCPGRRCSTVITVCAGLRDCFFFSEVQIFARTAPAVFVRKPHCSWSWPADVSTANCLQTRRLETFHSCNFDSCQRLFCGFYSHNSAVLLKSPFFFFFFLMLWVCPLNRKRCFSPVCLFFSSN